MDDFSCPHDPPGPRRLLIFKAQSEEFDVKKRAEITRPGKFEQVWCKGGKCM